MYMQAAAHVPVLTSRLSLQDLAAHEVGQALGLKPVKKVSQTSPLLAVMRPSPQESEQSASVSDVQSGAQQPSGCSEHSVTSVTMHRALQSSAEPTSSARRHIEGVGPQSNGVGQAPGVPAARALSHASPRSTFLLPHTGAQSVSSAWL
jgi:hypothetical protein